jgi:hypothetical protein
MKSIERKETILEIEEVNHEIREIQNDLEGKKIALKKQYDLKYDDLLSESKDSEKSAVQDYDKDSDSSKKELSEMINSIREKYESDKEDALKDKIKDMKKLERDFKRKMIQFAQNFDDHPYIQVIKNSGHIEYGAVARE